jgi:hypothetical protein
LLDKPGDPARDDPRLARPRACENQQRSISGLDGRALFGIQIVDELLQG